MLRRFNYPEFIILFLLCLVFYTAMHYYSSSVLDGVKSIELVRKVMFLRLIFSVSFAILLGVIGVKLSGHIWPAALVHGAVVAGMLIMDFSLKELMADWILVLMLVGTVASISALSGALMLGYYWLRSKRRL